MPDQPNADAPDSEPPESDDLLYQAWTIIANVDWDAAAPEWRDAAERWRDRFHEHLDAARPDA